MFKSYMQTVEILFPKSHNIFHGMKVAPPRVPFDPVDRCTKTRYYADKEITVYWEPDGVIQVVYGSGIVEIYHPKPTLKRQIETSRDEGEYFREYADGSIEYGYNGTYYYWGPDCNVEWDMSCIGWAAHEECRCLHDPFYIVDVSDDE